MRDRNRAVRKSITPPIATEWMRTKSGEKYGDVIRVLYVVTQLNHKKIFSLHT